MSTASTLETMMHNELAKLEQEYRDKSAPFIAVLSYLESMKPPPPMALTPDMVEAITSKDKEALNRHFGKFASAAGGVSPAAAQPFKFKKGDLVRVLTGYYQQETCRVVVACRTAEGKPFYELEQLNGDDIPFTVFGEAELEAVEAGEGFQGPNFL